ncbi:octopamine receptor beta-2R-like [Stylophora pistillata]|uniref:octopamine receptor beta-2R-like n=1 Tax=Stylophora pistillata TaxID=50429 RepID=UPI000C04732C|nr:octopamine receptor beta-2R-like [Stylophora pistillata]
MDKHNITLRPDESQPCCQSVEATLSLVSGISLVIISFTTVLGNGMLCVAMYKNPLKRFRTAPMLFVTNLAVADFLTGSIVDPLYITYNFGFNQAKDYQTALAVGDHASYITVNVSLCSAVVLVIDRFLALKTPFLYRRFMTKRNALVTVVVLWVYSILFSFLPYMGTPDTAYYLLDLHIHVTGSLFTLTVFLLLIYRLSVFTKNQRVGMTGSNPRLDQQRIQLIRDKKTTCTFLIILAACYICLLPYYIYVHVFLFCPSCQTSLVLLALSKISEPVVYLNCALNPFIYAWRHKVFRKSLRIVFMPRQIRVKPEEMSSQRTLGMSVF